MSPLRILTRAALVTGAAAAALLAAAMPAGAYIAPGASILSASSASSARQEQADDLSTQVAISGDGSVAVFTTRARNLFADDDADPAGRFRLGGIFWRDLSTGELRLVAHGDLRSDATPDSIITRGALNPSVSADGRYVAFSTGWKLSPDDTNGNVDVYVRDMTLAPSAPGAYDLVSRSSSGAPAQYAPVAPELDRPGVNQGSELTVRSAISADGHRVVFRTNTVSNLPAATTPETPSQQLFLRDRSAGTTQLVTRDRITGAPAGGALAAAVLSADGTTVLWVARNAPSQAVFPNGEGDNPFQDYYLWRRMADGDAAPTRRVTGWTDPDDPACAPNAVVIDNPSFTGPCYGPLAQAEGYQGGIAGTIPSISGDGRRVAFLTTSAARGVVLGGIGADLYVTDMAPGVGRKNTTFEVTRDGGATAVTNAPLESLAMSADGRWAVVSTLRTGELLPTLQRLGRSRAQATTRDLQLIDLSARTIERASIGLGGADTDGPVSALPAISADGRRIAFLSSASNMFYGDANDRIDAFFIERQDAEPVTPPIADSDAGLSAEPIFTSPAEVLPTRLVVRAGRSKKASLLLRIKLPEAGKGRAVARGRLRNAAGKTTGGVRVLTSAKMTAKKAGTLSVRLKLSAAMRKRLRVAGRLTASTQVRFAGKSGKAYVGRVTVEFKP